MIKFTTAEVNERLVKERVDTYFIEVASGVFNVAKDRFGKYENFANSMQVAGEMDRPLKVVAVKNMFNEIVLNRMPTNMN